MRHSDETIQLAREQLKAAGIPHGRLPPRQPTCECGRHRPADCDVCAVLAIMRSPEFVSKGERRNRGNSGKNA